jgi:REP element-mobilizing transposase RayT
MNGGCLPSLFGKNHDHRKDWIRDRLQLLAGVFGIEVCGYSIMSNHFHVVLRIRPDLVEAWSGDEIARRWLRCLCGSQSDSSRRRRDARAIAIHIGL